MKNRMDKTLSAMKKIYPFLSKFLSIVVWLAYPVILMMLFASLLTSVPYMRISKGLYESHELIEGRYDHDYVAKMLIDYLNYKHDDLTFGKNAESDSPVMRAIEIRHMVDVRDVYTDLRIAAGIALMLVVTISIYFWHRDKAALYFTYKHIFWVPLGLVVFLGSWIVIDFDRSFTVFHEIFFDNDDWILHFDDTLILLLPQNFWLVSAVIILIGTVLTMGLTVWTNRKLIRPLIYTNLDSNSKGANTDE